ncbi:alkaline phosphatase D family protein [Tsukamurella sp. 8F]|uniref:alkaline phosphatase D family protein n=1 Tax=unclassified Tsukamurella TaxID=2633480 RepID=UPI0023B8ADEA|nr:MULTISPECIES: alkaline phosphatase D family protein [unclassified Tsukamurella]MDF0531200.1 alkaline phosphatase D family protein [Tsukamurella sp. 8J]MDF0588469.1 alkaline phosphatase D family protein [Tsukamurella sp. 8F]
MSRRTLLRAGLGGAILIPAGTALAACSSGTPSGSSGSSGSGLAVKRPRLTHGVATGDPRANGTLVWARSDTPATMIVETAATESFSGARTVRGPQLTPATDGTGRVRITGLEAGQTVHYRVTLEGENGARSEPVTGVFTTVPTAPRDVHFLWSGDVVGQGWGINRDGGMAVWGAMADKRPDFFLHSGDAIYADNPVTAEQKQNDGRTYRSVTAPGKDQVAQTLDQFRGNYQYNLSDAHYLRFNSTVPQIIQWDDHEVLNNWFPGENLTGQDRKGYTETDVDVLAGRAYQAWSEWQPVDPREAKAGRVYRTISYGPLLDVFVLDMRSYKDRNPDAWATTDDEGILGREQERWLIDGLKNSKATWKVVANDLPLGIVVPDSLSDPKQGPKSMEAVAQGEGGAPLGREIALSRILSAVKEVRNIAFLTADVHYTAAISYAPERAAFTDFTPFWEFVSGPLNAGAFPQSPLDGTFGARYEFVHAPEKANTSPAEGFQHFGDVTINAQTRALTVSLCDATGKSLWSKELPAA